MSTRAKRVLVTGATGFIGRHTLPHLVERGFEVHGLVHRSAALDIEGVTWHRADLLNHAMVKVCLAAVEPTHLLHLAWFTEHGRFWRAQENLEWVAASLLLLQQARAHGVERVVGAGTCVEYDVEAAASTRQPLHERSSPLEPFTLYGTSKDAVRRVIAAFANDLSWAWGRMFMLYGPFEEERRLAPSVIRALLQERPADCTHGRQTRDFMDVRDAGAAFAALLDSPVQGPVNIASGQATTVAAVADSVAKLTGRPDLVRLDALAPPPDDPAYLVADVKRLRTEVKFRPRIGLEDGLRHAVEWWRRRLNFGR